MLEHPAEAGCLRWDLRKSVAEFVASSYIIVVRSMKQNNNKPRACLLDSKPNGSLSFGSSTGLTNPAVDEPSDELVSKSPSPKAESTDIIRIR